ncbi:hypothetical protein BDZ85DRAFT_283257 [Elsinoe ampelina]|uniref:Uncharacterized protein n=1 Tax=Elsinoe ampelina TaxID=302913 RepID=A0A6A6G8Z1_9PEZI|nr:hypothetical protein BDZ85DRAFT_283257 [Elsinoe ampelina]
MEKTPTNDTTSNPNANIFDTPKTLSRATTRDHSPPTRPCPAVKMPPSLTVNTNASDSDLEKGYLSAPHSATRGDVPSPLWEPSREYSVDGRPKECEMWPSKQTLKSKARMEKCHRRRKNCFGLSKKWGEMDKKKRLTVKILLALLIVGIAVGVAIGITRAVGGGVWAGQNKQKTIPSGH